MEQSEIVRFGREGNIVAAVEGGAFAQNKLVTEHVHGLNHIHRLGLDLDVSDNEVFGIFDSVRVRLEGLEDFQTATEVFLVNEYKFRAGRNTLVADVGMNAGFASLFFASLPDVVEVHSYEPFATPYKRALDNFALNPEIKHKVRAYNYGLSDRDSRLVAKVSPHDTIGTSVRGRPEGGVDEEISLRDVREIFAELISRARTLDVALVAKIDCEGSEFPIFEALDQGGMLPEFTAFMIEWHKWWSADKTSENIVQPLLRNGFFVLDRTLASNPHAGMLYAARS
jgi:FkbM family methyltransferase